MPDFGTGFLRGYTTIKDQQAREAQAAYQRERDATQDARWDKQFGLQEQRLESDAERWDKQHGLQTQRFEHSKSQAEADHAWREKQLAATQDYRKQSLGMQSAALEYQKAEAARARREAERRRTLEAAAVEYRDNGLTPRFRSMLKDADVPVDDMIKPQWQKAKQTLLGALQGQPHSHDTIRDAAGIVYQHKIDAVVGQKTKAGETIVNAELADYYPTEDGKSIRMELDLTTDKGWSYKAPVTSTRSPDDEMVLDIPVDKALGYFKGMDMVDKMMPPEKINSLLEQELIRTGGQDAIKPENRFIRADGGIFDKATQSFIQAPEDTKDLRKTAASVAKERLKVQEDQRIRPGNKKYKTYEQLLRDTYRGLKAVTEDGPEVGQGGSQQGGVEGQPLRGPDTPIPPDKDYSELWR